MKERVAAGSRKTGKDNDAHSPRVYQLAAQYCPRDEHVAGVLGLDQRPVDRRDEHRALVDQAAAPYVELSPIDAAVLGITPGQRVVGESRRGETLARAFVTHTVQPGHVFVPMHYARTNQLTFPAFDPHSRQPAYKSCAVSVRAARGDVTGKGSP